MAAPEASDSLSSAGSEHLTPKKGTQEENETIPDIIQCTDKNGYKVRNLEPHFRNSWLGRKCADLLDKTNRAFYKPECCTHLSSNSGTEKSFGCINKDSASEKAYSEYHKHCDSLESFGHINKSNYKDYLEHGRKCLIGRKNFSRRCVYKPRSLKIKMQQKTGNYWGHKNAENIIESKLKSAEMYNKNNGMTGQERLVLAQTQQSQTDKANTRHTKTIQEYEKIKKQKIELLKQTQRDEFKINKKPMNDDDIKRLFKVKTDLKYTYNINDFTKLREEEETNGNDSAVADLDRIINDITTYYQTELHNEQTALLQSCKDKKKCIDIIDELFDDYFDLYYRKYIEEIKSSFITKFGDKEDFNTLISAINSISYIVRNNKELYPLLTNDEKQLFTEIKIQKAVRVCNNDTHCLNILFEKLYDIHYNYKGTVDPKEIMVKKGGRLKSIRKLNQQNKSVKSHNKKR